MRNYEGLEGEYVFDRSERVDTIADAVAETYSLDLDITRLGTEWARDWWYLLTDGGDQIITRERLLQTRDRALDGLPIPRDKTEGRPTFRVEYAAQEALVLMVGETYGPVIRQLLEEEYPVVDGHRNRAVPNFKRIDEVLTTLLDSYDRRLWPYNLDSTRVPQDRRHMPRRDEFKRTPEERTDEDNLKRALFWFHDCYYMRGVNDSNDMTINLAQLYEEHSELFDPHHSQHLDPPYIEQLLLEYHLPVQHKQISEFWVENAKRLVARYAGDPRKIFDNFGTYKELLRRVCNDDKGGGFLGFRKKMTSMLGYFYMINNLVPYQNIPLPVDFHVMRLSIETEMITFPNIHEDTIGLEQTADFLRNIYYDFADQHDVSQLDLCDVVWLYSREACVQSPTNSQKIIGERAGRATVWAPAIQRPEDATPKELETYHKLCGTMCRLSEVCQHNVPSGEYYVSGRIMYPNPKLHFEPPAQRALHDKDTLVSAQQGTKVEQGHAIDKRNLYRKAERAKRLSKVRKLAHPALVELTPEQTSSVEKGVVKADRLPTTSLAGKPFAFTKSEIIAALGEIPDEETLQALMPYLNFTPETAKPPTLF